MFEVQNLIFLYILLCSSTLVFNIFYMIYRDNSSYKKNYDDRKMSKYINEKMEMIKNEIEISDKEKRKLERKLKRVYSMFIFEKVLEKYDEDKIEKFVLEYKSMFINLCRVYLKKDSISMSYYAYILGKFKVGFNGEVSPINNYLFTLLRKDSIYCIDNSLSVLYEIGIVNQILKAIIIVNNNSFYQNVDIITNGLSKFTGNKEELARKLFENFNLFNDNLKIAIINYISNIAVKGNWNDEMYNLILIDNLNIDIKISIINYFGKHYDKRVKRILYDILKQREFKKIEYLLVAIKALKNYPCNETIINLKNNLQRDNWNIQVEAAKTLSYLGVEYFQIADIYNGENQSARNILMYMRKRQMGEGV